MTHETSKKSQFLFVEGPSLTRGGDSKSRNTRSALIRRRISEKKGIYRQEEEAKRQELIAQRQIQDERLAACCCICRGVVRDQAQTPGDRDRPIVARMRNNHGSTVDLCGTCGKLRASHRTHGSTAPYLFLNPAAGRADPFSPVDPSLGPGVEELVKHAVLDIWPNFRHADYAKRCYESWVVTNPGNRLLIYSTLWAASCHRDVLRISYGSDPVLDVRDQLYYKGRILNLLREHVVDFFKEEWRDGIIMSILYLAVNETARRDLSRDPSPFTPPFEDMQSLSFYGSRDYHTMHWNVICDMLQQLGGIHTIKLFALGWLISIADLMNAAHSLTKPLFQMVDVKGDLASCPPPLRTYFYLVDPSEEIGHGFRELQCSCPPVKDTIVDVFQLLSLYSTLLQWYYNRQLGPADCDRFADFRNHVHHTLFSLPNEHDPLDAVLDMGQSTDELPVSHELYLTCRLAANLYATHVTFPLPRSALLRGFILPLLASRLYQMMQTISSPLLLWCATVAAIAAEGVSEYCRLDEVVKGLCLELKVTSYTGFVGILQRFAWAEVACSGGCLRLWERLSGTGAVERLQTSTAGTVG